MTQLTQADLTYLGAFKLPATYNFGGGVCGFNPVNNSLYVGGLDAGPNPQIGEVSIPAVVNSNSQADLNTASALQALIEPTEGGIHNLPSINGSPTDLHTGSGVRIGGLLVSGSDLIVSAWDYYDASNKQIYSHWKRPLNLSTTGQVTGPYRLRDAAATIKAGFVSGWQFDIPTAWQTALGAKVICGNGTINNIARCSYGPAAFGFDPARLGVDDPVIVTPYMYYPQAHPALGAWNSSPPTGYNGTVQLHGGCFPEGFDTVIFWSNIGTAPWGYGPPTSDPNLVGTMSPSGQIYVYEPLTEYGNLCRAGTGPHAWPYVHRMWLYDVNDFVAAKNGSIAPWEVLPYATVDFDVPFQGCSRQFGGVAYDPDTQRIYVIEMSSSGATANGKPLIHVFKHKEAEMPKTVDVATQITTVPAGDFKVKTQLLDLSDAVIDEATSQPFNVPADPPSTPNVETPVVTVS